MLRVCSFLWPFALMFSVACVLSMLVWSAVMDLPFETGTDASDAQPTNQPATARSVLPSLATQMRPRVVIQSTSGVIVCFSPYDPALLGQTISVSPDEVVPTAHQVCQDD